MMKLGLKKNRHVLGFTRNLVLVGMIFLVTACGSKKPKSSDGVDAVHSAADAGTDAVPQTTAEPAAEIPPVSSTASPAPPPPGAPPQGTPPPATPPSGANESAGTPAPSSASSQSAAPPSESGGQPDTYTIKGGDTLMKIAFEVYGDVYKWKEIYEANKDKLSDPNSIPKNVTLKVTRPGNLAANDQPGEKYLIKKGDTLGKISGHLYGTPTKWKEIWETNKKLIHNPNKIFAGFYLHYTPSEGAAAPASQSTARATDSGAATSASPVAAAVEVPSGVAPPVVAPATPAPESGAQASAPLSAETPPAPASTPADAPPADAPPAPVSP